MPESLKELVELVIGFLMLISGWMLSFLIVLEILPKNFILTLLAYALSLMGLALALHGFTGILMLRIKRGKKG
jgi:uncharacterized membrane protein